MFPGADGAMKRVVGVTTASGANSDVQITTASPMPLAALAVDAQQDGGNQIIVSDGRGARRRRSPAAGCKPSWTNSAGQAGRTCSTCRICATKAPGWAEADPGDGRHLVALQAVQNNGQWTVRRTQVNINGTSASTGQSDTVAAFSQTTPR